MKISIRQRLAPYSHTPGALCLIPGTDVVVEVLPQCVRVGALEIPLPSGRCTLQQDLMRNCVWVFSKTFRAKITSGGIEVKGRETIPLEIPCCLPQEWERLSLGSHKAQDWDLALHRFDLREILPVVFGLSQKMPPAAPACAVNDLSRAHFRHMLMPQMYQDIRALFICEEENTLHLLPSCPFDAGRMTNLQTKWGSLDIEWTKKALRRMVFRARKTGSFSLLADLRVKTSGHDKGRFLSSSEPFSFEAGKVYFLEQMM